MRVAQQGRPRLALPAQHLWPRHVKRSPFPTVQKVMRRRVGVYPNFGGGQRVLPFAHLYPERRQKALSRQQRKYPKNAVRERSPPTPLEERVAQAWLAFAASSAVRGETPGRCSEMSCVVFPTYQYAEPNGKTPRAVAWLPNPFPLIRRHQHGTHDCPENSTAAMEISP